MFRTGISEITNGLILSVFLTPDLQSGGWHPPKVLALTTPQFPRAEEGSLTYRVREAVDWRLYPHSDNPVSRDLAAGTSQYSSGLILVANSLCRGQEKRTIC
jgi:hypothetical protein